METFYEKDIDNYLPLPQNGRVSFSSEIKIPDHYWQSIGYINIKNFSFRIDIFEILPKGDFQRQPAYSRFEQNLDFD